MSCPAMCVFTPKHDGDDFTFDFCQFYFVTDTKKYAGKFYNNHIEGYHFDYAKECTGQMDRFDTLSDFFMAVLSTTEVQEVALEDYAMRAKGQVFHIGENTGILKYKLWASGHITHVYAPTAIKKSATSKGTAKKEDMYAAFLKETGVDLALAIGYDKKEIASPLADIVDAYFVAKHHYYLGFVTPKKGVEA